MFTSSVGFSFGTTLIALGVFACMLAALALGHHIARLRLQRGNAETQSSSGAVSGAVFGLLGLLMAFSFSGAADRFENRRVLIVKEANAIGTAYLRLDLVEPVARDALKEKFRRYLDARLSAYRAESVAGFEVENGRASALQGEIWSGALAAASAAGTPAQQLLLPAINDVIDITTTRSAALETHPPPAIYGVLILLTLLAALLAGIGMSPTDPQWVLRTVFSAALTLTIYLTLDLEHPRLGFIRVDGADHFLLDVRKSMR